MIHFSRKNICFGECVPDKYLKKMLYTNRRGKINGKMKFLPCLLVNRSVFHNQMDTLVKIWNVIQCVIKEAFPKNKELTVNLYWTSSSISDEYEPVVFNVFGNELFESLDRTCFIDVGFYSTMLSVDYICFVIYSNNSMLFVNDLMEENIIRGICKDIKERLEKGGILT